MTEREGGGRKEGESDIEESIENLWCSFAGGTGGIELWAVVVESLLEVDCFLRKGIFSFVVEEPAPLVEEDEARG
jgi:hypothetical protein